MFIGSKEISKVKDEGNFKVINFDEEQTCKIHKDLYDKIVSEEKGEGTITDMVFAYLAKKFLVELACLGLEFYAAEGVGNSLQVLAHNLREKAIGKKFDCESPYNIKLSDLL